MNGQANHNCGPKFRVLIIVHCQKNRFLLELQKWKMVSHVEEREIEVEAMPKLGH